MEQFVDFASSVGPALEELVCENGMILARGLSNNSSSFQPPRAQTAKRHGDILTTKRPTLGTMDGAVRDFCLPSLQDGMEPTKHNTSLHDDHLDIRFGMFFEDTEDIAHDKHVREPQVVPVYDDGILELPIARNIDESDKFSFETFADPFDKQKLKDGETPLSRSGLTNSKFQMVNSRSGKHLKLQNFSLFPRPEALNNVSGAAKPTSGPRSLPLEQSKSNYVKQPEGVGNPFVLPLMEEGSYSLVGLQGFQNRLDPTAGTLEAIRPIAKPPELSPTPDEQSEALFHICSAKREHWPDQAPGFASDLPANTINEEPDAGKLVGQDFATTSTCSRGASNDVEALRWRHEYLACPSENVKDEQVEKIKQVPARGSAGSKRKTKQGHKLTEKRRHNKINKKMRQLQKLIPNCSKVDKASILDEAIQYLIALQLQVQMMSMGTAVCMPPIMLPTEMQRLRAPYLSLFPRMNVGFGYNTLPPFSTSAILGLHGQVLQTSMSGAPLVPFNGGHSA